MKNFWTFVVAAAFALVGKWIGRFVAKTHFTDDTSAILTVGAHRAALARVGRVAIGAFGVWVLMLCIGGLIAKWIRYVGWVPLIALNCCLALLAGTAASLAVLLGRPFRYEALQFLIDQKLRLIEYLKRFIPPIVVIALVGCVTIAHAGGDCVFGIDPTPSVNGADRAEANDYLLKTVFEATEAFGCQRLVTVVVGCDVRHARRRWIDVPPIPPPNDCAKVEPEPLSGHSQVWNFVATVVESRKDDYISECEAKQATRERDLLASRTAFLEVMKSSLIVGQRSECSRITPLAEDLLESGLYRLVVVVTDGVDNPPSSLRGIVVPDGVRVVIVLTRPNPAYARVEEGLARAAEWAKVPGVTVITVAELRPGLWRDLAARSKR